MGDYKSFVDLVLNERQWIEVDIEGFGNLTDGKKPAFRCLPFGNSDWLNPVFESYTGVPVLSGKKREMDSEDMQDFLRFAKRLIMFSVKQIREVDDEGTQCWVPCKIVDEDDDLHPRLEDGVVVMPLRAFDTQLNLVNIASAIIRDSNQGGRMAELAPAEGFRGEAPVASSVSSETNQRDTARDPVKQKRRAG